MQIQNTIANLTQQEQYLIRKITFLEQLRNRKIYEENQEIEILKKKINELEQEQMKEKANQVNKEEEQKANIEIEENDQNLNQNINQNEQKPCDEIINQTITDLLGNQENALILPNSLSEGKIVNLLDLYM